MATFDDFSKLEMKVGKVLSAERVEGSDKLIKLEVDTGETRTLVAGIGKVYNPEDLKDKTVIVLANLEPKEIMGIESQGMLLVAWEGDEISLLAPDREMRPGTKVG